MKEKFIQSVDGYCLSLHIFEVEKPKAIIQIIHGMEEHQERYEHLIEILNKNNFTCISSDLRGHGKNTDCLGYFAKKNGHKLLIEDQKVIRKFINEKYKDIPVFLFAHSMGTMISRILLQTESKKYDKVVFSGYANFHRGANLGIFITRFIQLFHGAKYKSKFIHYIALDSFNKEIENPRTEVDWICKNEKTVDKYIQDPLCGFGFTCSAFADLFKINSLMHKAKKYKNVKKTLPFLLLRGTEDACTGGEKGVLDSIKILSKAGFKNLTRIDYNGFRHEIINENENEKVFLDIIEFLNK